MEAQILKERFPWIFRPRRPVVYTQEKEFEMRIKFIDSLSVGAGEFQASEFQSWFIVEFATLGGF